MKRFMLAAAGILVLCGAAQAEPISGTVQSVDPERNSLTLIPSGQSDQYNIVWDESLQGAEQLENAQVGDEIAVDANRNFFTRNWKVASVSSEEAQASAGGEAGNAQGSLEEPDAGDTSPSGETLMQNAGESVNAAGQQVRDAGETVGAGIEEATSGADEGAEEAAQEAGDAAEDAAF